MVIRAVRKLEQLDRRGRLWRAFLVCGHHVTLALKAEGIRETQHCRCCTERALWAATEPSPSRDAGMERR